ncbi:hypothetical protein M3Y99_01036500 [Aphelenchoides fujianensis]|nr:hypothetical protein M3Y99_01036500 [Aphelenchoides fujianensis]
MKTIRKFGFDLAHDTRHEDEVHEGDRCHPCVPFFGIVLIILVAAVGTWALLWFGARNWYSKQDRLP